MVPLQPHVFLLEPPKLTSIKETHFVLCFLLEKVDPGVAGYLSSVDSHFAWHFQGLSGLYFPPCS